VNVDPAGVERPDPAPPLRPRSGTKAGKMLRKRRFAHRENRAAQGLKQVGGGCSARACRERTLGWLAPTRALPRPGRMEGLAVGRELAAGDARHACQRATNCRPVSNLSLRTARAIVEAGGKPPAPESCRSAGHDRGAMAMAKMLRMGRRTNVRPNRQPNP